MIEIDGRQIEAIHMNYDTIEKFGSILDRPISGDEDLGVRMYLMTCKRFKHEKNPRGVKVETYQKYIVKLYYDLIHKAKSPKQAEAFVSNLWVKEAVKGLLP